MEKTLWGKRAQWLASLLLAATVLGVVIYQGPEIWEAFQKVNFQWAAAGLGCYFVNYLLRAFRLRTISGQRLNIWPDSVRSVCLHGLATYLLPLRTGDLALPVILKSISNTTLVEGGRILLKARLLDISTLGFWTLGAALFLPTPVSPQVRVCWILVGTGMGFAFFLLRWLGKSGKLRSTNLFHGIIPSGAGAAVNRWEIIESLAIWAAVGTYLFCTARAVGLLLGMGEVWILITIQLPLQLIPVQGIANAGNHEGGWVAALAILGIPASEGLKFALTSHALILFYVLMLGPVALVARKSRSA